MFLVKLCWNVSFTRYRFFALRHPEPTPPIPERPDPNPENPGAGTQNLGPRPALQENATNEIPQFKALLDPASSFSSTRGHK